jgi:F0F1-type ATP synthase membrane subunit c/vacuolar-type H+-ATPase subunit K
MDIAAAIVVSTLTAFAGGIFQGRACAAVRTAAAYEGELRYEIVIGIGHLPENELRL